MPVGSLPVVGVARAIRLLLLLVQQVGDDESLDHDADMIGMSA